MLFYYMMKKSTTRRRNSKRRKTSKRRMTGGNHSQWSDINALIQDKKLTRHDVCPICHETFLDDPNKIIYKTSCCRQYMHNDCIYDYCENQIRTRKPATCPLCRKGEGSETSRSHTGFIDDCMEVSAFKDQAFDDEVINGMSQVVREAYNNQLTGGGKCIDEFVEKMMKDDTAIQELRKFIPSFDTRNPYANIMCTCILFMCIYNNMIHENKYRYKVMTRREIKPLIYLKGGIAVQMALSGSKPYISNDADFVVSSERLAVKLAAQMKEAFDQHLPAGLEFAYKQIDRNDSSSVIKISIKPSHGPFVPIMDISYISSEIDDKIFERFQCTHGHHPVNVSTWVTYKFCSPILHNLLIEKLYYIDYYTSNRLYKSHVANDEYDKKFISSLHRSINALLDAMPNPKSTIGIDPKTAKIYALIDDYISLFGAQEDNDTLFVRLQEFIMSNKRRSLTL